MKKFFQISKDAAPCSTSIGNPSLATLPLSRAARSPVRHWSMPETIPARAEIRSQRAGLMRASSPRIF